MVTGVQTCALPICNAAFNTIRQLGGASGTAVATAIVNTAEAADPVTGTATGTQLSFHVLLGAGVVAFVAALVVFIRPGRPAGDPA